HSRHGTARRSRTARAMRRPQSSRRRRFCRRPLTKVAATGSRMGTGMELVHPVEPTGEESPLARARLHRQLTLEETARRSGLTVEQAQWLEGGGGYGFPLPGGGASG